MPKTAKKRKISACERAKLDPVDLLKSYLRPPDRKWQPTKGWQEVALTEEEMKMPPWQSERGTHSELTLPPAYKVREGSLLRSVGKRFLGEIGYLAFNLMYRPSYTHYPIIDEANIRQALETVMHPKHWRIWGAKEVSDIGFPPHINPQDIKRNSLYFLPGFKYETREEGEGNKVEAAASTNEDGAEGMDPEVQASGEEEAKEIKGGGQEGKERHGVKAAASAKEDKVKEVEDGDPDKLIREAALADVYMSRLEAAICGIHKGNFGYHGRGDDFDGEKDKERKPVHDFLEIMNMQASRALFNCLTSEDKVQINRALGNNFGDLPEALDVPLDGTGAKEFDKVFPLPSPEFRFDVCEVLPDIRWHMLDTFGRIWFCHVLTPGAAAILTAALSSVLYKTYILHPQQPEDSDEEEEEEEDKEEEVDADNNDKETDDKDNDKAD